MQVTLISVRRISGLSTIPDWELKIVINKVDVIGLCALVRRLETFTIAVFKKSYSAVLLSNMVVFIFSVKCEHA